jgi:hypothetical protein
MSSLICGINIQYKHKWYIYIEIYRERVPKGGTGRGD